MLFKNLFNLFRWSVFFFLIIILATCSKDIDPPQPEPYRPPEVFYDTTNSKVITVDSSGIQTTISSNGIDYTLTIPKVAVYGWDTTRAITITPIQKVENLSVAKDFIAAIDFKADSISFCQPIELKIEFPSAIPINQIVGFSYRGDNKSFYRFPIHPKDISSTSVTFSFTHFSGYGVGSGTNDSTQEPDENQTEPTMEEYYQDKLADILYEAGNIWANVDLEKVKNLLLEWFNQIPLPINYIEIDIYVEQYKTWLNEVRKWEFNMDGPIGFVEEKLTSLIDDEYVRIGNVFGSTSTSCDEKKSCLIEALNVISKAQYLIKGVAMNVIEPIPENFYADGINRFPISIQMAEWQRFPYLLQPGYLIWLRNIYGDLILNADDMVDWSSSNPNTVSYLGYDNAIYPGYPYSSGAVLQANKIIGESTITATITFLGCSKTSSGIQYVVSPVSSIDFQCIDPWPLGLSSNQHTAFIYVHSYLTEYHDFPATLTGTNSINWPNGHISEITWSSSDLSILQVDDNGLVTLGGGIGYATITATCMETSGTITWQVYRTSKGKTKSLVTNKNRYSGTIINK